MAIHALVPSSLVTSTSHTNGPHENPTWTAAKDALLCRVGKVGKKTHSEVTKKWEQQCCEVLVVTKEAKVVWMRTLQRTATQCWVKSQSTCACSPPLPQARCLTSGKGLPKENLSATPLRALYRSTLLLSTLLYTSRCGRIHQLADSMHGFSTSLKKLTRLLSFKLL